MRTSVDISDALFEAARKAAKAQDTTLRALIEEGLRLVLAKQGPSRFRLPDLSFEGTGLRQGIDESDWQRIRDLSYEGRGG